MTILRTLIICLLAAIGCSTASADDALTVTALTASADEGIVITFSRDVKVKHSIFGTTCYKSLTDNDAIIKTLNATPSVSGNVVTLTAAYCTFVDGHHMQLELNPECFTTTDGATALSGTTAFSFIMGEGREAAPITAVQVSPSNGTLVHLGNIAVIFSPTISTIVDPTGYTVVNENGHSLPILNVIIDTETSIAALNVNIDPAAQLEGGTTYSLHIAPRAVKCGGIENASELVIGRWYVKPEPLMLTTNPPDKRMVESLSRITISAANGQAITCTDMAHPERITISGIMDDAGTVYAAASRLRPATGGKGFVVDFDRTITPQSLEGTGVLYNTVRLNIPEGFFAQNGLVNDPTTVLWKVQHAEEVGEVNWSFVPQDGTTLDELGELTILDDAEGNSTDYHTIAFSISGENAYLVIHDATQLRIVNGLTGATLVTFGPHDLRQTDINAFTLTLPRRIIEDGVYTLIIPAANIALHSDSEHFSTPVHPLTDVEATWCVGQGTLTHTTPLLLQTSGDAAPAPAIFDLYGRRTTPTTRAAITVAGGRKQLK